MLDEYLAKYVKTLNSGQHETWMNFSHVFIQFLGVVTERILSAPNFLCRGLLSTIFCLHPLGWCNRPHVVQNVFPAIFNHPSLA